MKRLTILFCVLAVGLVSTMALAQVVTTGTVVVIVQDEQGGRLPGATVTAAAADSITSREAITNETGEADSAGHESVVAVRRSPSTCPALLRQDSRTSWCVPVTRRRSVPR